MRSPYRRRETTEEVLARLSRSAGFDYTPPSEPPPTPLSLPPRAASPVVPPLGPVSDDELAARQAKATAEMAAKDADDKANYGPRALDGSTRATQAAAWRTLLARWSPK